MANPDPRDVDNLVELFNQSDWDELYVKTDGLEIFLSNDPQAGGHRRDPARCHRARGRSG